MSASAAASAAAVTGGINERTGLLGGNGSNGYGYGGNMNSNGQRPLYGGDEYEYDEDTEVAPRESWLGWLCCCLW